MSPNTVLRHTSSSSPIEHNLHTTQGWIAAAWFEDLKNTIMARIEELEAAYAKTHRQDAQSFHSTSWTRTQNGSHENTYGQGFGGGHFDVLRDGALFEKAGVAFSKVRGNFPPEFAKTIPGCGEDGSFHATGISLVFHPRHPHVPIVHMNTRFIQTEHKSWFGGGADLTPVIPTDTDKEIFHHSMREACDTFHEDAYTRFSAWCDEYFYLPHRQETRGVGGIFYDYMFVNEDVSEEAFSLDKTSFEHALLFTKKVGLQFLDAYAHVVKNNWHKPITESDLEAQKVKRARYAEFNLLYDRGIKFGLNSGGNIDAMFMSLPPQCGWA